MIIEGLFKQYKKWNPVHPTSGAFWGLGIGIGCGVGWGPGFGPEVIGYVGAGCGIGFSVGITLVGVGIGLPTSAILEVPCNALAVTGRSMLGLVQSSGLIPVKDFGGYSSKFQREENEGIWIFDLKFGNFLNQRIDVEKLRNTDSSNHKPPVFDDFNTKGRQLSDSHEDAKN